MGLFDDLFGSSGVAYPTGRAGAQNAPGTTATAQRDGFFEKLFAPQELAYPVPARPSMGGGIVVDPKELDDRLKALLTMLTGPGLTCTPATPSAPASPQPAPSPAPAPAPSVPTTPVAPAPAAPSTPVAASTGTATPVASSVAAPAPSPVTVVFALDAASLAKSADCSASTARGGSTASSGSTSSTTAAAASGGSNGATSASSSTTGTNGTPTALTAVIGPDPSKVLRAYVFNPEFTPCYPTAQETYLEEILEEEVIRSRLITRDATPVAFVVPDGCDSVDLLYSPIEVNPGVGTDEDLNQVVLVSDAKLSANVDGIDGPLKPGDQVIVTVPWRAASWVDMPAGTLRMQVMAHFYRAPVLAPLA